MCNVFTKFDVQNIHPVTKMFRFCRQSQQNKTDSSHSKTSECHFFKSQNTFFLSFCILSQKRGTFGGYFKLFQDQLKTNQPLIAEQYTEMIWSTRSVLHIISVYKQYYLDRGKSLESFCDETVNRMLPKFSNTPFHSIVCQRFQIGHII